jgi:hypothetical protein
MWLIPDRTGSTPAVRHEEGQMPDVLAVHAQDHREISSTFADLAKSRATVGGTSDDQPAKRKKLAGGLSLKESKDQALWCYGPDGPVRTRRRRR